MKACVASKPGTIGFLANTKKDSNFSYQILYVDGYAPSAHNAAAGLYHYAYDVNMAATGNSTTGAAGAAILVADAANWAALTTDSFPKEAGTWTSGDAAGFVASTIGNVALYTIPGIDGGATTGGTGSSWSTSNVVPEALFVRGQDNCTVLTNSNAN
jgi:hypothetical protein